MEFASSTEADDAFKRNQTHVRAIEHLDGKFVLPNAGAILTAAK
jgi:hypothetical protein